MRVLVYSHPGANMVKPKVDLMTPECAEPSAAEPEELKISHGMASAENTPPDANLDPDGDAHKLEARVGAVTGITPGMSNNDLLEAILTASDEQLIPWEFCDLPSGGRYYKDGNGEPWSDGIIRIRPMGQAAEKVLATQRLAESGQSLDYLFKECCSFPSGFDPVDLLVGDRMFILYYLRGITHGNIYEFIAECPNDECKQRGTHSYDLNELAHTVKRADPGLGPEPFKVVLPYLSSTAGKEVWVKVRYLRGIDSNNMISRRKVKQRTAGTARPGRPVSLAQHKANQARERVALDNSLTESLEQIIVEVLGAADVFTIRRFVQRMHAQDTATVREWLRDNTPGIDSTVNLVCSACNNEFTIELPITESFFRPQKTGRIRE